MRNNSTLYQTSENPHRPATSRPSSIGKKAALDTVAAGINQSESRAGGSGSPGGLLSASSPFPQEWAVRSIRGICHCTCIRHRPDTEGFSAPSSLRFLPLVFPISPLNRRFQGEHSARILSGFTAHPALRALSRRAPLQQPLCLLPAARRIASLAGMQQHAHPQPEEAAGE